MRILIDTNILIHLEGNKVIQNEYSNFYNLAKKYNCHIYIHPLSKTDLKNDSDRIRQSIQLSKLEKYEILPSPAVLSKEVSLRLGEKKPNDFIDNNLLFQLVNKYVDLLITEDNGIIKKARKINLASNVKTIKDALILLRKKFVPIIPQHPELRHLSIRDLATYINDPFFDSLKLDYQEFNSWFQKCLQENRYSYSLFIENKLSALLIYKVEAVEEHQIEKIFHKALKISTFKVGENAVRHKIGELFLRKMFEYCINQNIQTLYLTVFPKHQILISLLETYGFTKYSKNKRGEFVMVKDMMKPSLIFAMNNSNVKTYPFYTDVNVNKFIVPISHRFYNRLFKDGKLRVPNLFDESLNSFAQIEGKTIEKAYICRSKTKNLQKGDILLFYASGIHKAIEPIGILEKIIYSKNQDEILNLVDKRTVYSKEEIHDMVVDNEIQTVILFKLITYLESPIKFNEFKELQSTKNNLVTITKLSEKDYQVLKSKNKFDERYLIY